LSTLILLSVVSLTTGCAKSAPDSGETADTQVAATNGMPEGDSTWTGTVSVSDRSFPVEVALTNTGGDVAGQVTIQDDPDAPMGLGTGIYSVTGTHEPVSGRIAIAPQDWVQEPDLQIELVGLSGSYDPATQTLSATVADYASGADNTLTGGPAELSLVTGDGTPTAIGGLGAALPEGERTFTGTHQCIGGEREVAGTLTYDGVGDVSGELSFGNLTLADGTSTFAFTGVHNPSTGGVTLIPGLYSENVGTFAAFFVEATFDPGDDAMAGEGRINVGSCPSDLFQANF
jgi:hypothetical protein